MDKNTQIVNTVQHIAMSGYPVQYTACTKFSNMQTLSRPKKKFKINGTSHVSYDVILSD